MMKYSLILAFTFYSVTLSAQKFSGQWSGSFDSQSDSSDRTEYFLELEVNGTKVEGTSTTYFIISGKRYYTICKVTGSYDPRSKTIVSKEVARVKANTPEWFKDCFQVHTLTYFKKRRERNSGRKLERRQRGRQMRHRHHITFQKSTGKKYHYHSSASCKQ